MHPPAPHRARPDDPLAPFVPTDGDPWDEGKAAHLLRRAGFGGSGGSGGSGGEVAELVALGPAAAVDRLVDFPSGDPALERAIELKGGPLTELDPRARLGDALGDHARAWWFFRMTYGRSGLQEKLTLFWHAHFACRESELLQPPLLLAQNRLLRSLAAAPFPALLAAVARDPAMLTFLDNRSNRKGRPNENWARELCELFTLGLDRYSQRDVVEIARVFTGWGLASGDPPRFEFHADAHDSGDKEVSGVRIPGRAGPDGIAEGDELLERLAARPECALLIARRLSAWFVADEPAPELAAALAGELRANGFSVREGLRKLFRSQAFYAPELRLALTRTPVDFVVATARALAVQNAHLLGLEAVTARMGMQLFKPPSVAGWALGGHWIHASAAVQRSRFAAMLAGLPHTTRAVDGAAALDLDALAAGAEEPRAIAAALAQRLLPEPASGAALDALAKRIERDPDRSVHRAVRLAIATWTSAPETALA